MPEAALVNCPRCDELVIAVECNGVTSRLSRTSIPYADALVLGKYGRLVWNVWAGALCLRVSQWFPTDGAPAKGRLYTQHFCGCRK